MKMVHLSQESHSIKRKLFPPNFRLLTSCVFLLTPDCHPYQCGGTHTETDNSNFLSFSLEISNCPLILKVLNQISCLPVLNTNLKPIYQRSFIFHILHISRPQQKSSSLKLGCTFFFFFNDMKRLMFISPSFKNILYFRRCWGFAAAQAFSSCGEQGLLFVAVCRLPTAEASLAADRRLQA